MKTISNFGRTSKMETGLALVSIFFYSACANKNTSEAKPAISQHDPAQVVGGGCDGCEIMFNGMPADIDAVDTSAGWHEEAQKLIVNGKAFKKDGKTPAPGVVLYYWQTDAHGYYSPSENQDPIAARHGHIRGWVKTDDKGTYTIYTCRPGPYPNAKIPAHIHFSIKEPNIANAYYPDDILFDDDAFVTAAERKSTRKRCGNAILKPVVSNGIQTVSHSLVLGVNIPGYPSEKN